MRWATGLASFKKENVEKAFSNGLVQSKCLKYNLEIPPYSQCISSEEVLVISPHTLIKNYKTSAKTSSKTFWTLSPESIVSKGSLRKR